MIGTWFSVGGLTVYLLSVPPPLDVQNPVEEDDCNSYAHLLVELMSLLWVLTESEAS